MDAFTLARQFVEFVATEWPGNAEERGHFYEFFEDWAQEADLLALTAGERIVAVETFLILVAWFAQRPDDFSAIREFVTVPIDLTPDARSLPGILDEGEWNRRLFRRKYDN